MLARLREKVLEASGAGLVPRRVASTPLPSSKPAPALERILGQAPRDPTRSRWMNYYGPRKILPAMPYDRFLEQPLLLVCGAGLAMGFGGWRPGWALVGAVAGFLVLLLGACLLMWIGHWWFPWLIIGGVQIPCALLWSVMAHLQQLAQAQAALQKTLERVRELPTQATVQTSPPAPAAGERRRLPEIPDHVPLRCVGRGAYGEVWLARDVIGGFRAVKVVYRNTFVQDEPFEREFRGIQKFTPISRQHPGWVDILHVGRNDAHGYFYYIMELGDDETAGPQIDPDRYVPKTLAGFSIRKSAPIDIGGYAGYPDSR